VPGLHPRAVRGFLQYLLQRLAQDLIALSKGAACQVVQHAFAEFPSWPANWPLMFKYRIFRPSAILAGAVDSIDQRHYGHVVVSRKNGHKNDHGVGSLRPHHAHHFFRDLRPRSRLRCRYLREELYSHIVRSSHRTITFGLTLSSSHSRAARGCSQRDRSPAKIRGVPSEEVPFQFSSSSG